MTAANGISALIYFTHLTFQSLLVTWCANSLTFNNCTLCPRCIYVFSIYLRTNSDLCHLQHKLIGFYNRDEKCLLRSTDWDFKWSSLLFIFKGLKCIVTLQMFLLADWNSSMLRCALLLDTAHIDQEMAANLCNI